MSRYEYELACDLLLEPGGGDSGQPSSADDEASEKTWHIMRVSDDAADRDHALCTQLIGPPAERHDIGYLDRYLVCPQCLSTYVAETGAEAA
jgi:hypothetical protein